MKPGRRGFTLIELLIVIAIIAILALIAIPNFIEAQTRSKVSRVYADMRTVATALESYFVDYNAYPRLSMRSSAVHQAYARWLYWEWIGSGPNDISVSLTTPIPYLASRPPNDPFLENGTDDLGSPKTNLSYYMYNWHGAATSDIFTPSGPGSPIGDLVADTPMAFNGPNGRTYRTMWALLSPGPNRQYVEPHAWDPSAAPEDARKGLYGAGAYFALTSIDKLSPRYAATAWYDPTNGTISNGHIWRLQSTGGR